MTVLMQLFALIGDIHDDTVVTAREKNIVKLFLLRHLNNELAIRYMNMFEEYLEQYNSENIAKGSVRDRKRISLNSMRILAICEQINMELRQQQKIYVLVQLMDFIQSGEEVTDTEIDFISTVADAFNIPADESQNIRSLIMGTVDNIQDKRKILIIDNNKANKHTGVNHICRDYLGGRIVFLYTPGTNTYLFRYSGDKDIYMNGQNISSGQTYIFDHGSTLRASGTEAIYYTEIVSLFSEESDTGKINIDARNVTYRFRRSENGIHDLNFREESGTLVGIIGGSGAGKSTTMSIFNGTLKPQSGDILVNGYNLYDENEKEHLRGVIGYVPQDDLLIEELTVYQNLYYNAKMCLGNLDESRISEMVNKVLSDLNLEETRDLKVGNPLKKIISGGQRKRINIALELLREPEILFVDEPTSGLSSIDTEVVMALLKEQTYKGKLVIVNIHQPASDIYKMFDKIMIIDRGGYQVFYGNPTEAIVYFKTHSYHANPTEDQCIKCGNVNTDQILQTIEAKVIDEYGRPTQVRKVTPKEWAEKFREYNAGRKSSGPAEKLKLPENNYSIPGLLMQSRIFFARDILSKFANSQYVLISLLEAPFLALLLAFFTRYSPGDSYLFRENENLPSFLFMCVITSLFLGLIISAEEIIKDRKILKRESFLNLSWNSYLNSKVLIMFIISAIQTISFILVANTILEIRGMTLSYWIILFTTSCFANLLGLNLSSAFNSVITIYILIPFILIPQLLFSGVMVKFDKLHTGRRSTYEFVPVIGELMAARWSFEAIAVEQFSKNKYARIFFSNNLEDSQNHWYAYYMIPALKADLQKCMDSSQNKITISDNYQKINMYITMLSSLAGFREVPAEIRTLLEKGDYTSEDARKVDNFLDSLASRFRHLCKKMVSRNDSVKRILEKRIETQGLINLRNDYENIHLSDLVLARNEKDGIIETSDKIIQKYEPAYMKPVSKTGRAHFYTPYKRLGNMLISTFLYNVIVLWLVTFILYLALNFKLLQKLVNFIENSHFMESSDVTGQS